MKKLILIIVLITLNSCIDKPKPIPKKSYETIIKEQLSLKMKNDTTFLNFVFGWSRTKTKNHINKLIRDKKIGRWSVYKYQVLDRIFSVEGYNYNLQLNDSVNYKALLRLYYLDNHLSDLSLYVVNYPDIYDLKNFLGGIYGFYDIKKDIKYSSNSKYYWLKGDKQVTLSGEGNIKFIGFTDLRAEVKRLHIAKMKDSFGKIVNKMKRKITKKDFN